MRKNNIFILAAFSFCFYFVKVGSLAGSLEVIKTADNKEIAAILRLRELIDIWPSKLNLTEKIIKFSNCDTRTGPDASFFIDESNAVRKLVEHIEIEKTEGLLYCYYDENERLRLITCEHILYTQGETETETAFCDVNRKIIKVQYVYSFPRKNTLIEKTLKKPKWIREFIWDPQKELKDLAGCS